MHFYAASEDEKALCDRTELFLLLIGYTLSDRPFADKDRNEKSQSPCNKLSYHHSGHISSIERHRKGKMPCKNEGTRNGERGIEDT